MDGPAQRYDVVEHPWRWFEDIPVDLTFECGVFAFSENEIVSFARCFDPQVFHIDADAARDTFVGQLFASLLHTLSASVSLVVRATRSVETVVGFGLRETEALGPVLPGVDYSVTGRWASARLSQSRPGQGIVAWQGETTARDGQAVLRFGATMLVRCRSAMP